MENNKYVKVTKGNVTKKVDKKLVKSYVSAGWKVDTTPTITNTFAKFPYQSNNK